MFHEFPNDFEISEIPESFTYPFNYVPHRLSVKASQCARTFIDCHLCVNADVQREVQRGKMFGVLVVKNGQRIGYLIAFSGNINHSNNYQGFVPPVFDLLDRNGFFVRGEDELNRINTEIKSIESSAQYTNAQSVVARLEEQLIQLKLQNRLALKQAKELRNEQRQLNPNDAELIVRLNNESSFLKAECKRAESKLQESIATARVELSAIEDRLVMLKLQRKENSAALQQQIFEKFVLLSANGEERNLISIFKDTPQGVPPGGAGECAAPKLLQYAYKNGLKPICMAEFWVGESPSQEIRVDGQFYPSCKSKCEPILNFMMQGLNVEPNPILQKELSERPRLLFQDEWIMAFNKPSGVLSMRGKIDVPSMDEWLKVEYAGCDYFVAHRLDMDTSGVLLVAKDVNTYKSLQGLFAKQRVTKVYKALVQRELDKHEGKIELPLIADIENRPFQKVDFEYGKEALTEYRVLNSKGGVSLVEFRPLTGRTHQLRVHSAHASGLHAPIVGDNLYGNPAERLMLHAESVEFIHPVTGQLIVITAPAPFTL